MTLPQGSGALSLFPSRIPSPSRIYMVGFMGSGKTTVGAALARRLEWDFLDLDDAITRQAARSIEEIFRHEGEEGFRVRERTALAATANHAETVVATGGGTFLDPANVALIASLGSSIYLDVTFDDILRRLGPEGRKERPLFTSAVEAARLFEARVASYRRADLQVSVGSSTTPDEVAARITARLRGTSCAT